MIRSLVYVSKSRLNGDLGAIETLRRNSVARNLECGITGALHYDQETFFQMIEGPEDAIEALMARIEADPRHTDAQLLYRGDCPDRMFPEWQMKFVGGMHRPSLGEMFSYDILRNADHDTLRDRAISLRAA